MTGEMIKSFLVGLGFEVDDSSLGKFNKAITTASLKVTALYASIKLTSAAIVYSIAKISEGFEEMGYEYKIIAPAINKALILRREMLKAYSAAGVNIVKVVQASLKLNLSLTKTRYAFEAIYRSVASRFFDLITKQSDLFRQKIYANMPKIQAALERFVKFIFKALEATVALGIRLYSILTRVYDFFLSLDRATDGWSTIILGVIAAWELLSLSFLATPFGLVVAGLTAILALYDDFKTWEEGGKSFIDWETYLPAINAVTSALKQMWGILQSIADAFGNIGLAIAQAFQGDWSGAIESTGAALKASAMAALGLAGGGGVPNFTPPTGAVLGATAGAGNTTTQNVNQQTQITVNGVADAQGAGSAVAGQQNAVNRSLSRNFKPVVR